jgi:hypothetical protein
MLWSICLTYRFLADRIEIVRKLCHIIPLLVNVELIPQPEPWVTSDLIKERFVKDLQVLATIDQLASRLSDEMKNHVQGTVRRLAQDSGGLPEGMELNFGEKKQY